MSIALKIKASQGSDWELKEEDLIDDPTTDELVFTIVVPKKVAGPCDVQYWWDCKESDTCTWQDDQCKSTTQSADVYLRSLAQYSSYYRGMKQLPAMVQTEGVTSRKQLLVDHVVRLLRVWAVDCVAEKDCNLVPSWKMLQDPSMAKLLKRLST